MNNFILENTIDLSICDDVIEYHKNSDEKQTGKIYESDGTQSADPNFKISTDVILPPGDLATKYIVELHGCVKKYIEKYSYAGYYGKWSINEPINIQHYKPNEGFFSWHTERTSNSIPGAFRVLVFMTYLNDVDDGGETEFFHQNIKVKPKKGKTLIWPADWTHTHRGITSPTQEKYIVTGWFSYF